MAFFDNLGKKVSEAGQKTIQKTKELSDTTKLNTMIADEEKRINNNYFQIGKLYASVHRENCDEEFSGMISAIVDSEMKIKDYKRQIQDIKGVQRCEKCGAEVQKDAAFCSFCGASMPKIQSVNADDLVRCENCGAAVKKGMRFCTACGKSMETISDATAISADDVTVEESQRKVCSNCGAEIFDDSIFCTECGTKLC